MHDIPNGGRFRFLHPWRHLLDPPGNPGQAGGKGANLLVLFGDELLLIGKPRPLLREGLRRLRRPCWRCLGEAGWVRVGS
jgi:hypothetical protein